MAKILILNGSPHLEGYVSAMIETFKSGLAKNKNEVVQYNLAFMNIHDSIGENYPIHDDMEQISKSLEETDYVIFASPLYYFSYSGYLKCTIDRFQNLTNIDNKKLLCFISMGSSDETIIQPLREQSQLIADHLKWKLVEFLYLKGCKKPTNIQEHVSELERFYQAGLKIK